MTRRRAGALALALGLAALVGAVYAPVRDHAFLAYDDVLYVTGSARVQAGLTAPTLRWAFTATEAGNWHPLAWLSHAADVEWFGLDAGAHHLTNVAVHAFGTALLFAVLFSLTGSPLSSALAAALFGLHPLRIESVAWIAERKDVLCGAFFIGALGAELRHARAPSLGRQAFVGVCVVGALMSKAMAVTLPAALLLFDVWPLGRWRAGPRGVVGPLPTTTAARLAAEKLPLLALALAASAVAVSAQSAGGALSPVETWPVSGRLANAATSYWAYLHKTIWPSGLAVFYPYPVGGIGAAKALAAALGLALVSGVALRGFRAGAVSPALPAFSFGWFWFVGTLLPVIGIVTVGEQALADRYTYVPHVGFAVVIAVGLARLERGGGWLHKGAVAAAILAVAASIGATRSLLPHWKNDRTLFARALAVTTDSRVAHLNYGNALEGAAPAAEQIRHFERAVKLGPTDANAHYHLGRALAIRGETERGIAHYRLSLALDEQQPKAWNNLGNALARQGDRVAASAAYRRALEIDPDHRSSNYNLALALVGEGRTAEAQALAARYLAANGPAAPREADIEVLARAFADAGDLAAACELLEAASKESAALQALLGGLEWQRDNARLAIAAARRAFALDPSDPTISNDLAWMLATAREATLRDPSRALELATRAVSADAAAHAGRRDPALLDTLAAAHAASGDFDAALRLADEALRVAEASEGADARGRMIEQLGRHAASYRANRPLHESSEAEAERPGASDHRRRGDTGV